MTSDLICAPAYRHLSGMHFQYSRTDLYDRTSWASLVAERRIGLSTHIHYRLVLGTVGYGLKTFRGTDELLRATYDAFQGEPSLPSLCLHPSNRNSHEGRSHQGLASASRHIHWEHHPRKRARKRHSQRLSSRLGSVLARRQRWTLTQRGSHGEVYILYVAACF